MHVVVISNFYDRKNLRLLRSSVLSSETVDGNEFYEPLVEAIYNNMINEQDCSSKWD